jgi:ribosome-associated protein
MNKTISITGESIELIRLLKFAGLVENGAFAKDAVRSGLVHLNGELAYEMRKQIQPGDSVVYGETTLSVVAGEGVSV